MAELPRFEFPEPTPFKDSPAAKATEAVTITLTLGQALVLQESLSDWLEADAEDGDDADYTDFLSDLSLTYGNQIAYWAKKHGYTEVNGLPIR